MCFHYFAQNTLSRFLRLNFLLKYGGGGYVTSQSIAQIICSLRVSLGDDAKSIIVTIPKLGYKLTAVPCWEEPETEPNKPGFESSFPRNIEVDNFSFSIQSMINVISVSANSMSVIPYSAPRAVPDRKKFTPQTLFLSAVAALFLVLFLLS
jgi:DNA-binding winged helix-turn-helix (wHTH) protein